MYRTFFSCYQNQNDSLYRGWKKTTLFTVKNCFFCYYSVSHCAATQKHPGGQNRNPKMVSVRPLPLTTTWHLLGLWLWLQCFPPHFLFRSSVCHSPLCQYIMQSVKPEWGINGATHDSQWDSSFSGEENNGVGKVTGGERGCVQTF